jgi:biotin carboxyl carrier protein
MVYHYYIHLIPNCFIFQILLCFVLNLNSFLLAGQIIAIKVQEGSEVVVGQEIMFLTAMKMENIIVAERNGKVARILVNEKDNVSSGQVLLEFA